CVLHFCCFSFSFFPCFGALLDLLSFPTRRSSDLFAQPVFLLRLSRASIDSHFPAHWNLGDGQSTRRGLEGHDLSCARKCHSSSRDRKSTRLNSSHRTISYAVFCLKKKKAQQDTNR